MISKEFLDSTLFVILSLGHLLFRAILRGGRGSRRKSTNVISIMIVIAFNCYRVCFFHHKRYM